MVIRKATSKDAKGIIEVNVKTWCTTYSEIIPKEILQGRVDNMDESIRQCEATVEEDDNVLVVEENQKIIGIASYGPARAVTSKEIGELYSIYVLKDYQSKGIGEKLFKEVKRILQDKSYKSMVVTCLCKNPYNKFYKKMGGKITKKIKSNIYGTILEENLIEFSI